MSMYKSLDESLILDLGCIDFSSAYEIQKEVFLQVKKGLFNKALIICEHNPVITLGRLSRKEDMLVSFDELKERNIQVVFADRGGRTTYHGPGQLVVYFIFNLEFFKKDLHYFLRYLEEKGILFLSVFGVKGVRKAGFTGVWVDDKKNISIGIAVKNWITYHGMSINIKEEAVNNFSLIHPCGMDIKMVSLEQILQREISLWEAKQMFLSCFKNKEVVYV